MKRWPLHRAHFWETAPFFALLLPLVTGILLHPAWAAKNWLLLAGVPGLYLLIISFTLYKTGKPNRKTAGAAVVHLALIALGIFLCSWNDVRNRKGWYGHTINKADFYRVRIEEPPVEKERSWKLRVSVYGAVLPSENINTRGEAFVYVYKDKRLPVLRQGDTLLIVNKWMPVTNPGNPFEFDYAAYCARNDIFHQEFVGYKNIPEHLPANISDKGFTDIAHDWSMETLQRFVPDKQSLGLIQSMLIGDESNLDKDTREAFAETGIAHIIAISGGHIVVLLSIILFLLAWIRNKKYLWLKYVVALPVTWFYVMMAGGAPSAVRAALMFTILSIGFVLQKRKDSNTLNHLFAAAFILLVAQPMWLFSVGFQLSFAAVLSLILFYRRIYRLLAPAHFILKWLWGIASASIAAEILVAPLVMYYFHSFPVTFLLSNIVACVLMALVLILGMSVLATSFIPALAATAGALIIWLVNAFTHSISFLQQLELPAFHTIRISGLETILLYLLIASLAIFLVRRNRPALFAAGVVAVILISMFSIEHLKDLKQKRLVVYNVGKGHYIELIEGTTYRVLAGDTSAGSAKEYAVEAAHIGWQALKAGENTPGNEFSLANKQVLILKDTNLVSSRSTPDYLIIAYPARLKDLRQMDSIYRPKSIVLSHSLPQSQLNNWKANCRERNIALLPVQEGAFILEDR